MCLLTVWDGRWLFFLFVCFFVGTLNKNRILASSWTDGLSSSFGRVSSGLKIIWHRKRPVCRNASSRGRQRFYLQVNSDPGRSSPHLFSTAVSLPVSLPSLSLNVSDTCFLQLAAWREAASALLSLLVQSPVAKPISAVAKNTLSPLNCQGCWLEERWRGSGGVLRQHPRRTTQILQHLTGSSAGRLCWSMTC